MLIEYRDNFFGVQGTLGGLSSQAHAVGSQLVEIPAIGQCGGVVGAPHRTKDRLRLDRGLDFAAPPEQQQ